MKKGQVMKIQIIKIIPCLLAGFILSACVGAVNLAEGTIAESKTENTELETQTPKKLVIKEPEPQDKKVIETVESKPISANPCIANPFKDTCGGTEFNDAREAICLTERESHRCLAIISVVCPANIFDSLCTEHEPSFPAQKIICADELDSNRCAPTVARICGADSLDPFCIGAEAYYPAQETACEGVALDSRGNGGKCAPTFERVCGADIFDSLCNHIGTEFQITRRNVCRYSPGTRKSSPYLCGGFNGLLYARFNACKLEPNSDRCATIKDYLIETVCKRDSLDALCAGNETYYRSQKSRCGLNKADPRCALTIERICGLDSLDALCAGNETYYHAQETACAGGNSDPRCYPTIARACPKIPFSTLCQSSNLTLRDLPARPNNNFKQKDYHFPSLKLFYITCSSTCNVHYYSNINTKPLNQNNSGIATYAGELKMQGGNQVESFIINLTVNFNTNKLTYAHDLVYDSAKRFRKVNINGEFTDRGQITGSVKHDWGISGIFEAPLIGLIGQDEAFGVFAVENNGYGKFAGGFTATREPDE